jgi:hypothetical protein
MLTKYVFFILIIVLLVCAAKKSVQLSEHFEDVKKSNKAELEDINIDDISRDYVSADGQTVELIDNKELIGSFKLDNIDGKAMIDLDGIQVEFNLKNVDGIVVSSRGKVLASIKKAIQMKTAYRYRLIFFPLEEYMILLLDGDVVYNGYSKMVGIPPDKKIKVLVKGTNGTVSKLLVRKSYFSFFNSEDELFRINDKKNYFNVSNDALEILKKEQIGDKKSIIWNLEHNDKYYSLRSIVSNLYLGIDNKQALVTVNYDKQTKLIVLKGKKNYVILGMDGTVLNAADLKQSSKWVDELQLDKVENVGNWLNFGTTVNIVNNENQYLSGNLNFKYDFKGASGLPSVYGDDEGTNPLIQWTIDSYGEKKRGYYIKEGDNVYLKNNGMHLQIIKGNPTPGGIGMEISLGPEKNNNSKWVILHKSGASRLFRKDEEIYLYHPKTELYLYNTGNKFMIAGKSKIETIGIDKKNAKSVWKIGKVVSLEGAKQAPKQTINFYQYNTNQLYFEGKEKEWKQIIADTNAKIQARITKFNKMKSQEKDLDTSIVKSKENIHEIQKTKCPPRKVCLNTINYPCKQPAPKEKTKKEKEQLYDVVYVKEKKLQSDPRWINSNVVEKCKTVRDFDLENSSYIKTGKYVPKKGAKTKLTDFSLDDFPEAKDYVSIEDIPFEKKITDFKISELPGFNKLQLKK